MVRLGWIQSLRQANSFVLIPFVLYFKGEIVGLYSLLCLFQHPLLPVLVGHQGKIFAVFREVSSQHSCTGINV